MELGNFIYVQSGTFLVRCKVLKITPSGRFEAGGWVFNRDGSQYGATKWHRVYLVNETPEVVAQWEAQQRRKLLAERLSLTARRLDTNQYTDEQISAILAALEGVME